VIKVIEITIGSVMHHRPGSGPCLGSFQEMTDERQNYAIHKIF